MTSVNERELSPILISINFRPLFIFDNDDITHTFQLAPNDSANDAIWEMKVYIQNCASLESLGVT